MGEAGGLKPPETPMATPAAPAPKAENASSPEAAPSPAPPAETAAKKPEKTEYWPSEPKGGGLYTVQLATPKEESRARKIVENFRKNGLDAYYYPSSGRYFVRAGRYQTKNEAEIAKIAMESAGAVKPYVSRLNPD
jgi:cell division septation protein DedD